MGRQGFESGLGHQVLELISFLLHEIRQRNIVCRFLQEVGERDLRRRKTAECIELMNFPEFSQSAIPAPRNIPVSIPYNETLFP